MAKKKEEKETTEEEIEKDLLGEEEDDLPEVEPEEEEPEIPTTTRIEQLERSIVDLDMELYNLKLRENDQRKKRNELLSELNGLRPNREEGQSSLEDHE